MIGLVHLVWAPLGPAPLRDFLSSYHAHPPGAEHELVLALNGASPDPGDPARRALLAELDGTEHRLIELERPVLDLAAYGIAARQLEHDVVCFVNSYAVILAERWLELLAHAHAAPTVGLVGASGSWESQAEWTRGAPRHWPQQLATLARDRRDYPRFPNPHVRTSTFMLDREKVLEMRFERVASKREAYLLESGRVSITRRIQQQGLRAVVAARDGLAYDAESWPGSRTFRAGEQENLLVADNQTRAYLQASPRRRRRFARDTWGAQAADP